jgi:hypothetical protein
MGSSVSVKIDSYDAKQIAVLINQIDKNYHNYKSNIIDNRITGELLNNINDHDEFDFLLNYLKIDSLLHKKQLYQYFKTVERENSKYMYYNSDIGRNNLKLHYRWFTLIEKLTLNPKEALSKLLKIDNIYLKSNNMKNLVEVIRDQIINTKNNSENYKYDCFINFNNDDVNIAIELYYLLKDNNINPYFYNIFMNNDVNWKAIFLEGIS